MDGSGISFTFGEDDLATELARFGMTERWSGQLRFSPLAPLSPSATTWLAIFIGLCADIMDARRGTSTVDGRLILTHDELDIAVESRSHLVGMVEREIRDFSEYDRQQVLAWFSDLRSRAERQGNYAILSQVFKHGIDAQPPRAATPLPVAELGHAAA